VACDSGRTVAPPSALASISFDNQSAFGLGYVKSIGPVGKDPLSVRRREAAYVNGIAVRAKTEIAFFPACSLRWRISGPPTSRVLPHPKPGLPRPHPRISCFRVDWNPYQRHPTVRIFLHVPCPTTILRQLRSVQPVGSLTPVHRIGPFTSRGRRLSSPEKPAPESRCWGALLGGFRTGDKPAERCE